MNGGSVPPAMERSSPKPEIPIRFIVVTFVVAAVVGAAILYFGITGQLGAGVP